MCIQYSHGETLFSMGRPRIYPEGTPAVDRVAAGDAALVEAGGARKQFRLSPAANAALHFLMSLPDAPRTETGLIERLLLEEGSRKKSV